MSIAGVNGMDMFNKQNHTHRGMVLVISLLVTAIVLSIGMNLANIAAKQLVLSSFNKESHKAIFMADAALECVLYWDNTTDHNDPGDNNQYPGRDENRDYFFRKPGTTPSELSTETVSCFNNAATGWTGVIRRNDRGNGLGNNPNTVDIAFDLQQGTDATLPCARVEIHKELVGGVGPSVTTSVKTYGYNTCDTNNPRRVERGLEMTY